ncbi:GTPase [Paraburkholderia sp. B3]|uniref:GTPase n=1 Tax=Paraburkholderia sp. B3 TaxID=3134791 RepID=UPI0039825738
MSKEMRSEAAREVVSMLPNRARDLARLQTLAGRAEPTVTVIGKYNHGKSRLLNELIGRDTFAVADRRETMQLAGSVHQGVRWLDAPGLDADVGSGDDRHALQAAWLESDIRLFVHAAKEGELDTRELSLLKALHVDSARTQRQTLFVLSQADQLADDVELAKVGDAIGAQVPGLTLNVVSSTRHRKGLEGNRKLLLEKSGIPDLRVALAAALASVPNARAHETALLFGEIRAELQALRAGREAALEALCRTQREQRQDFDQGLDAVVEKVGGTIGAMLDALGTDHAAVPDSARDAYAITAGKLERAQIQIVYSRACIEIDAFLAGHGVVGLPQAQQTAARSLNSVMVAVMGVSVKFRKDLRRMFCEASGRQRMQREFTQYFEVSADRQTLATRIVDIESIIAALDKALAALATLEAVA